MSSSMQCNALHMSAAQCGSTLSTALAIRARIFGVTRRSLQSATGRVTFGRGVGSGLKRHLFRVPQSVFYIRAFSASNGSNDFFFKFVFVFDQYRSWLNGGRIFFCFIFLVIGHYYGGERIFFVSSFLHSTMVERKSGQANRFHAVTE